MIQPHSKKINQDIPTKMPARAETVGAHYSKYAQFPAESAAASLKPKKRASSGAASVNAAQSMIGMARAIKMREEMHKKMLVASAAGSSSNGNNAEAVEVREELQAKYKLPDLFQSFARRQRVLLMEKYRNVQKRIIVAPYMNPDAKLPLPPAYGDEEFKAANYVKPAARGKHKKVSKRSRAIKFEQEVKVAPRIFLRRKTETESVLLNNSILKSSKANIKASVSVTTLTSGLEKGKQGRSVPLPPFKKKQQQQTSQKTIYSRQVTTAAFSKLSIAESRSKIQVANANKPEVISDINFGSIESLETPSSYTTSISAPEIPVFYVEEVLENKTRSEEVKEFVGPSEKTSSLPSFSGTAFYDSIAFSSPATVRESTSVVKVACSTETTPVLSLQSQLQLQLGSNIVGGHSDDKEHHGPGVGGGIISSSGTNNPGGRFQVGGRFGASAISIKALNSSSLSINTSEGESEKHSRSIYLGPRLSQKSSTDKKAGMPMTRKRRRRIVVRTVTPRREVETRLVDKIMRRFEKGDRNNGISRKVLEKALYSPEEYLHPTQKDLFDKLPVSLRRTMMAVETVKTNDWKGIHKDIDYKRILRMKFKTKDRKKLSDSIGPESENDDDGDNEDDDGSDMNSSNADRKRARKALKTPKRKTKNISYRQNTKASLLRAAGELTRRKQLRKKIDSSLKYRGHVLAHPKFKDIANNLSKAHTSTVGSIGTVKGGLTLDPSYEKAYISYATDKLKAEQSHHKDIWFPSRESNGFNDMTNKTTLFTKMSVDNQIFNTHGPCVSKNRTGTAMMSAEIETSHSKSGQRSRTVSDRPANSLLSDCTGLRSYQIPTTYTSGGLAKRAEAINSEASGQREFYVQPMDTTYRPYVV